MHSYGINKDKKRLKVRLNKKNINVGTKKWFNKESLPLARSFTSSKVSLGKQRQLRSRRGDGVLPLRKRTVASSTQLRSVCNGYLDKLSTSYTPNWAVKKLLNNSRRLLFKLRIPLGRGMHSSVYSRAPFFKNLRRVHVTRKFFFTQSANKYSKSIPCGTAGVYNLSRFRVNSKRQKLARSKLKKFISNFNFSSKKLPWKNSSNFKKRWKRRAYRSILSKLRFLFYKEKDIKFLRRFARAFTLRKKKASYKKFFLFATDLKRKKKYWSPSIYRKYKLKLRGFYLFNKRLNNALVFGQKPRFVRNKRHFHKLANKKNLPKEPIFKKLAYFASQWASVRKKNTWYFLIYANPKTKSLSVTQPLGKTPFLNKYINFSKDRRYRKRRLEQKSELALLDFQKFLSNFYNQDAPQVFDRSFVTRFSIPFREVRKSDIFISRALPKVLSIPSVHFKRILNDSLKNNFICSGLLNFEQSIFSLLVYMLIRMGFSSNIKTSEVLVNLGCITLNGQLAKDPYYSVRAGDIVSLKNFAAWSHSVVRKGLLYRVWERSLLPEHYDPLPRYLNSQKGKVRKVFKRLRNFNSKMLKDPTSYFLPLRAYGFYSDNMYTLYGGFPFFFSYVSGYLKKGSLHPFYMRSRTDMVVFRDMATHEILSKKYSYVKEIRYSFNKNMLEKYKLGLKRDFAIRLGKQGSYSFYDIDFSKKLGSSMYLYSNEYSHNYDITLANNYLYKVPRVTFTAMHSFFNPYKSKIKDYFLFKSLRRVFPWRSSSDYNKPYNRVWYEVFQNSLVTFEPPYNNRLTYVDSPVLYGAPSAFFRFIKRSYLFKESNLEQQGRWYFRDVDYKRTATFRSVPMQLKKLFKYSTQKSGASGFYSWPADLTFVSLGGSDKNLVSTSQMWGEISCRNKLGLYKNFMDYRSFIWDYWRFLFKRNAIKKGLKRKNSLSLDPFSLLRMYWFNTKNKIKENYRPFILGGLERLRSQNSRAPVYRRKLAPVKDVKLQKKFRWDPRRVRVRRGYNYIGINSLGFSNKYVDPVLFSWRRLSNLVSKPVNFESAYNINYDKSLLKRRSNLLQDYSAAGASATAYKERLHTTPFALFNNTQSLGALFLQKNFLKSILLDSSYLNKYNSSLQSSLRVRVYKPRTTRIVYKQHSLQLKNLMKFSYGFLKNRKFKIKY